jgi:hypothetical protein
MCSRLNRISDRPHTLKRAVRSLPTHRPITTATPSKAIDSPRPTVSHRPSSPNQDPIATKPQTMILPSSKVRSPYPHQPRDRPKALRLLAIVHHAFRRAIALGFIGFAIAPHSSQCAITPRPHGDCDRSYYFVRSPSRFVRNYTLIILLTSDRLGC